ncbi:MAG: hypothetical protein J3K34DRAFT_519137 [Monoraphidium minutum]|nr:MAG: hypothetical protein J3K34DRAFT_519137 [Monoraphidium minutum]
MPAPTRRAAAGPPPLVELCLHAAASAPLWTVQRRSVDALPPDLANQLLAALVARRAFDSAPQLLDRFAGCATAVDIDARRREPGVSPAQLIAWLASFRHLESLRLENSRWLRDAHLAPLAALAPSLRALSLRGCSALGATKGAPAVATLARLTRLESLDLSQTGLRPQQLRLGALAPSLARLTSLSLGGLQLDDASVAGVEALATTLRSLDLSDAVISLSFVEGALGALTALTRLQLGWCLSGALPVFGSVKDLGLARCALRGVAHAAGGGEVALTRLSLAGASVEGVAAVALPEILRASAATLEELDASDCGAPAPRGGGRSPLWLLPALAGAGRLRRLDLSCLDGPESVGAAAAVAAALVAAPPLAALGLTRLTELSLRGFSCVHGAALGQLLFGLSSLRRLDIGGVRRGEWPYSEARGGVNDAGLRALAGCGLVGLEELDASNSALEGRFGGSQGSGGGGGADDAQVAAAAAEVWRGLPALRALWLAGSAFRLRAPAAGLAAALGGSLERLSVEGLSPIALAALCAGCGALRELRVSQSSLAAADLERHLPRLARLERLELKDHNPLVLDAPRLEPLARRLRGAAVFCDGAAVACGGAAAPAPGVSPAAVAGGGGGKGGGARRASQGGGARQGDLSAFDQRLRYSRAELEALMPAAGPAAEAAGGAAARVRAALLGDDSGAARLGILRPDW